MEENVQELGSIIGRYKIDGGMLRIVWEMGNGEAKEPIYMTHGHELRGGGLLE